MAHTIIIENREYREGVYRLRTPRTLGELWTALTAKGARPTMITESKGVARIVYL